MRNNEKSINKTYNTIVSVYLAEFLSTFLLILIGYGVVAAVVLRGGKMKTSFLIRK